MPIMYEESKGGQDGSKSGADLAAKAFGIVVWAIKYSANNNKSDT
jgi:hypothetical protein